MAIKTKIRIKNGRWEINGKRLEEFSGDRDIANSLLMSTIRMNQIHDKVCDKDFPHNVTPKKSLNLMQVISTVNRPILKQQNYRFKNQFMYSSFLDEYPNIETISFVRRLGEE